MSCIGRWTIFSLLDESFVEEIRTAIVFGAAANEAIIVSKKDEVFGLGTNACSCLGICNGFGLGRNGHSLAPVRIESLCGKGIVTLAFGSGPHVLALSAGGNVYSWGHNTHCQLGNGSTNPGLLPAPVPASLATTRVVAVACGNRHCLAISDGGELFGWGDNSRGQVGTGAVSTAQATPKRVTKALAGRFVRAVCCGQDSALAVTSSGELFAWGNNDTGQLGVGTTSEQTSPVRVLQLQNVVVSTVAAGYAHSLALTDEGALFAWGSNSCGQLGIPNRLNQLTPVRVAEELGRIIDVSAVHMCNITAVRTKDGVVWMWGQIRGQSQFQPVRTPFSVLDDAFACFATPPVSSRPITFAAPSRESVGESVRVAFDDASTADVAFEVDGRTIHAHSAILRIRSAHLRSMLRPKAWTEGSAQRIEMREYSYPVFRAFLAWLYTDRVDLPPEDAVGLLDLANSYCEETLKAECAAIIRRGITVDNAVMLFAAAVRFNTADLEEFCFHFCLNHMTAVVESEAFGDLDDASVKFLITRAAKSGAFRH